MNLNAFSVLALLALFAGFAGVFVVNATAQDDSQRAVVQAPFATAFGAPGAFSEIGAINSFLFVLLFSLLFFGIAAPLALGFEGARYAALFSSGHLNFFDIAFLVPEVLAAVSATVIGKGIIDDYRGNKSVFESWDEAIRWLALGAAVLVVLLVLRPHLAGFFS
ncbi:MAG: hypothetical protein WC792_01300 [Candidatus Micrarchaeia archaeon]|jgi:hypothetical protein